MADSPQADPISSIDPQDLPDEKWVKKYKPTQEMFINPLENTNYAAGLTPDERVKVQKEYDEKIQGVFQNLGGKLDPSKGSAFDQANNLYNQKYMQTAAENTAARQGKDDWGKTQILWQSLINQARRGVMPQSQASSARKQYGAISTPAMQQIIGSGMNRRNLVGS